MARCFHKEFSNVIVLLQLKLAPFGTSPIIKLSACIKLMTGKARYDSMIAGRMELVKQELMSKAPSQT